MSNKYTRKPQHSSSINENYKRFNLRENPFPYNPFIEPESTDPKRNGEIFDKNIRKKELEQFSSTFLKNSLTGDHNRIGYLLESSFTGRGNGKSAFLINIQKSINNDYGYTTSDGLNKTFATYIKAQSGGHGVKFWQLSLDIIEQILDKKIIEDCIITLRYNILDELNWLNKLEGKLSQDEDFNQLLETSFYIENNLDFGTLHSKLKQKLSSANISDDFINAIPYKGNDISKKISEYIAQKHESWKKKELNNWLYDDIAKLMILANFNGGYILFDEFEKIVEYQKTSERIEFAYELRQYILENSHQSGTSGFFIFLITMHPGTQRLILEAWEKAGINARSPLPSTEASITPHVIFFDDIDKNDIKSLIKIYLDYYREDTLDKEKNEIYPFTEEAINLIAEISKFNAARILKFSHIAINELSNSDKLIIDNNFIMDLISKNKKQPNEDINSTSFLSRESNPLDSALANIKLKDR